MKGKIVKLVYAALILAFSLNVYAENVSLKVDLQDSRPKTIKGIDGAFSGLAIDLMKLIEQNSNYKFLYGKDFLPTTRIEKNIEGKETDLHFGFGKTDDREKRFTFSKEPLYDLQFILISNADELLVIKEVADIKKLGKDGTVLTILGTNTVEYLKKDLGLTVDDGAKEIDANLEKLIAKRAKFFVYNNLAVLYEMNLPKFKGKFKVQPIQLEKFQHYLMYNKATAPTLIKDMDDTIIKLKKSGEWDKITAKYLKE